MDQRKSSSYHRTRGCHAEYPRRTTLRRKEHPLEEREHPQRDTLSRANPPCALFRPFSSALSMNFVLNSVLMPDRESVRTETVVCSCLPAACDDARAAKCQFVRAESHCVASGVRPTVRSSSAHANRYARFACNRSALALYVAAPASRTSEIRTTPCC